eukprot:TRINITY_DN32037_c0_g1_i1.p1 TRINITY_DN32037_c0_g1~~TRINITY_DN32037_c0_g1_i1.p1  ORF type:complete len:251 (+),score=114.28 TRINITY_DN32037_c0_g1_i1:63-815(+)
MGRMLSVALLLLAAACGADAYYFFMQGSRMECFQEELKRKRSVVHVDYQFGEEVNTMPVRIEIVTPKGTKIVNEQITKSTGSVQATSSDQAGALSICVQWSKNTGSLKASLDVQVHVTNTGDWKEHKDPASGRTFYHNPNTKESTWTLPSEFTDGVRIANVDASESPKLEASKQEIEMYMNYMDAIRAVIDEIQDEAYEIMDFQIDFKREADSTYSGVFWMAMLQLCICAVVPAVQTWQMKKMFIKKKLV